MSKRAALLLIVILTASSLIAVKAAQASTNKPSIPEFTLKFVDHSYDVPPTYGIDPYTGKSVITEEGYHVDNRTIEFTIKNHPFTSYNDSSGNYISQYYNFRYKGLYGNEWSYYPFNPDGHSAIPYGMLTGDLSPKFPASNLDYTVVSVDLGPLLIPSGSQVEFQVQVLIGHIDIEVTGLIAGDWFNFVGETSGWSNTQTITISASSTPSSSPIPSPEPTPSSEPQQSAPFPIAYSMGIVTVIVLILLGSIVYVLKRKH